VHGHTPVEEPEVLPNRINIDTGAFATGQLTCVVLDKGGHRFLSV
jgi:serine/threonine protein phosphatase 1